MNDNYFTRLNAVNVQDKVEKKNGLAYLSWAWAWAEVKKLHPNATYTVYENRDGLNYHTDGRTCWVKTGVTVDGIEHIEYLPVMDNRNRSIDAKAVTSFDVNKAIQRSITKACARHGLGLYIYAGEDLPEDEGQQPVQQPVENPVVRPRMAEADQLEYIRSHLDNDGIIRAAKKYGSDLRGMTYDDALKTMSFINSRR